MRSSLLRIVAVPLTWIVFVGCGSKTETQKLLTSDELSEAAIEAAYQPAYLELATGIKPRAIHPWPCETKPIGHNIASYQDYGGGAYFHHGIDIMANAGSVVKAAAGGKIVNIENYGGSDAYWEIAILDDEGFIWQYHHVDHESIPQAIHDALSSGVNIPSGTIIGKVFYWSQSSFGALFHHIHLNVRGKQNDFFNPLTFLEAVPDTKAPVIREIGIIKNGAPEPDDDEKGVASDPYSLYVNIDDLMFHDKYIVPPYWINYRVDNDPVRVVWRFDNLPGGSSNAKYVTDFFIADRTCGDYDCRKFFINLGFDPQGNRTFTTTPGPHKIIVTASDFSGNITSKEYGWTVK